MQCTCSGAQQMLPVVVLSLCWTSSPSPRSGTTGVHPELLLRLQCAWSCLAPTGPLPGPEARTLTLPPFHFIGTGAFTVGSIQHMEGMEQSRPSHPGRHSQPGAEPSSNPSRRAPGPLLETPPPVSLQPSKCSGLGLGLLLPPRATLPLPRLVHVLAKLYPLIPPDSVPSQPSSGLAGHPLLEARLHLRI